MNIAEFFVKLGVNADTNKLKAFSNSVQAIPSKLLTLKNAFSAAVIYGVDRFVDSTVRGTVALQNFNNQTDLSIRKLQQWQVAGELSDISLSAEQVTASIQNLQKNLTNIRLGGGNIRPFQLLGIDVQGKNAFQVLEQVREAIKGLDSATAVNLIEQLGLSSNFINVLRISRKEFEALGKGQFLSVKQRDTVLKLGTAITKLKIEFKLLKDRVVADFEPLWSALLQIITKLSSAFSRLIAFISKSEPAMKTLLAVIAVLTIAFAPLASAIIGVILLIEDFFTYMEGGDSWIGDMIESISEFAKALYDDFIKPLEDALDAYLKFTGAIEEGIIDTFKDIGAFFGFGGDDATKKLAPTGAGSTSNNSTANFNNTYNIQSNGEGQDVADAIVNTQQSQLNYAYQDFNNGADI